jgi:glycosyltransferase involved in cell wall biosynthesis
VSAARPIRVMLVTGSFPPMKCGVGDYTQRLANALATLPDVQVTVLTSGELGAVPAQAAVRVYGVMRGWRLAEIGCIVRMLRELRPDIVHVQYPTQGYGRSVLPTLLPMIAWLCRRAIVQTWHEYHSARGLRAALGHLTKGVVPGGLVVVRPSYRQAIAPFWRWVTSNKLLRFIPNASSIPRRELDAAARADVRSRYGAGEQRLVVYFGFMHPAKNVHLLFEIAQSQRDRLVLIGEFDPGNDYHRRIEQLAGSQPWSGKVAITGFLPGEQVAELLAAADAVILPFADGGGEWNTSIHGAQLQGTFVLTTSLQRRGFDPERNTYYADPRGVDEMKNALSQHAGHRATGAPVIPTWQEIAVAHKRLYESLLDDRRASSRTQVA